jgi:hypothetical protein
VNLHAAARQFFKESAVKDGNVKQKESMELSIGIFSIQRLYVRNSDLILKCKRLEYFFIGSSSPFRALASYSVP